MINFQNLVKEFDSRTTSLKAVDNVTFKIEQGEIFGIVGLSGAGKSTLLRSINGLEKPTSGEVIVNGTLVNTLSEKELIPFRQNIGMIFQHFNLLNSRTVRGNIAFPLEILGWSKAAIQERVNELAKWIELEDKLDTYPNHLSGGQKQRVAIARALAANPKILLCDEATSALDPITTQNILKLLKKVNETFDITIVLITHEIHVVKSICDKVAVMANGKITSLGDVKTVLADHVDQRELYQKTS